MELRSVNHTSARWKVYAFLNLIAALMHLSFRPEVRSAELSSVKALRRASRANSSVPPLRRYAHRLEWQRKREGAPGERFAAVLDDKSEEVLVQT